MRSPTPSSDPRPDPGAEPVAVRRIVIEAVAVLVLFAVVGAGAGWLWSTIWDSPPGVVIGNEWFPDPFEPGSRAMFTATVVYVLVAAVGGLVLGGAAALFFHRSELATLAAVVVGGALAAWLMYVVGVALGPADPQVLARSATEGTRLPGALSLPGRSPFLAFPLGSLLGLASVYFFTAGVSEVRDREDSDPTWLKHPSD